MRSIAIHTDGSPAVTGARLFGLPSGAGVTRFDRLHTDGVRVWVRTERHGRFAVHAEDVGLEIVTVESATTTPEEN